MQFLDLLKRCAGQTVIVNNNEERQLVEVEEDFIVLRGGNPQMRLTEFVPLRHIVRLSRADYAAGQSSLYIDTLMSTGDHRRAQAD